MPACCEGYEGNPPNCRGRSLSAFLIEVEALSDSVLCCNAHHNPSNPYTQHTVHWAVRMGVDV